MIEMRFTPFINISLLAILSVIVLFTSCKQDAPLPVDRSISLAIPAGFPAMEIPAGNELTEKRVELGRLLFFDPILSRDSTISCSSCHFLKNAFSDDKALSLGVNNRTGFRNSPSLGNIGYHTSFFKDGGVPTLEQQVIAPIEDHAEMDFSVPEALERIKQVPEYVILARIAYDREPDPFVLTRAIAAYERTFITGNSRFDQYFYQNKANALDESEIRGLQLFKGDKANCSKCHVGFNLTNFDFKNNGLYEIYADTGRMRITLREEDRGKFKIASLRNIEVTAPYMHDGSLANLEDVIEHYNSGGKNHVNKDTLIQPLGLGEQEKADLVNFLKTLTDRSFITNTGFLP